MTARDILNEAAEEYGWDLETQLAAVLTYIENQQDAEAFEEYAPIAADEDAEPEDRLEDALEYVERQASNDAFVDGLAEYDFHYGKPS